MVHFPPTPNNDALGPLTPNLFMHLSMSSPTYPNRGEPRVGLLIDTGFENYNVKMQLRHSSYLLRVSHSSDHNQITALCLIDVTW